GWVESSRPTSLGKSVGLEDSTHPTCVRLEQGPFTASIFAVFFQKSDAFLVRLGRSLRALFMEINQCFHYVAGIPALLGLWWSWERLRKLPEFWVTAGYCVIHTAVLLALAMTEFYVSDRHVMPLVLCGSYLVAVGLREAPGR